MPACVRLLFSATALLLLAAPAALAVDLGTVPVSGTSNLWGAGHDVPPDPGSTGGGSLPPGLSLMSGTQRTIRFSGATGTVDYGGCCVPSPPDGEAIALVALAIYGGIAGPEINRAHHLAGVFLTDAEPVDPAPAALLIDDVSFGGVAPQVGQIFFVGDGLTGEGAGATQSFQVPDSATRLFLGYMDCFTPCTVPGGYSDNSGEVSIDVELTGSITQSVVPAPALAAWASIALSVGFLAVGYLATSHRSVGSA
jgi:hypothetical protein